MDNTKENETVRERFKKFMSAEAATFKGVGGLIGFDGKQRCYLLSRFNKGQDLNNDTLQSLSAFLTQRGY